MQSRGCKGRRRRRLDWRRVACVALALLGGATPPADASTSAIRTAVEGDVEFTLVHFAAAPGEANDLVVSYDPETSTVALTDSASVIEPGNGCSSVDAHVVRCVLPDSRVHVDLGDLDDQARAIGPYASLMANAGTGNDRLFGGDRDDVLKGGGGCDELDGGAGSDVLDDGDRDGVLGDAGPGPDVFDGGRDADSNALTPSTTASELRACGSISPTVAA